jgi:flagella basal body P-ring formation protein FlgA
MRGELQLPLLAIALTALCCVTIVGGDGQARAAENGKFLAPRHVIYPGDVIEAGMLAEIVDSGRFAGEAIVREADAARGRVARRTLLPGAPIPVIALSTRKVVRNGAQVRLVFSEGDLTIAATGDALQDGAAGETIKCRNTSSGVIVTGVVQADGSVRIGG